MKKLLLVLGLSIAGVSMASGLGKGMPGYTPSPSQARCIAYLSKEVQADKAKMNELKRIEKQIESETGKKLTHLQTIQLACYGAEQQQPEAFEKAFGNKKEEKKAEDRKIILM